MKSLGYVSLNGDRFRRGSLAGWFSLSFKDQKTLTIAEIGSYDENVSQVSMAMEGMFKYGLRRFWEKELEIQEALIKQRPTAINRIDELNRDVIKKYLPSLWFALAFWVASYLLLFAGVLEEPFLLNWAFGVVLFTPIPAFSFMILLSTRYLRRSIVAIAAVG